MTLAQTSCMRRHWLGMVLLSVVVAVVFGVALALGYPFVAYSAIVVGMVASVVLFVAWMRPKGSPVERHAAIDAVVDDLDP